MERFDESKLYVGCQIRIISSLGGYRMSPWMHAVQVLEAPFTGSMATGLALVVTVVGGVMSAFGEGGRSRSCGGAKQSV
jgi:type IV secretory pathway VirB2 component (pilin)